MKLPGTKTTRQFSHSPGPLIGEAESLPDIVSFGPRSHVGWTRGSCFTDGERGALLVFGNQCIQSSRAFSHILCLPDKEQEQEVTPSRGLELTSSDSHLGSPPTAPPRPSPCYRAMWTICPQNWGRTAKKIACSFLFSVVSTELVDTGLIM